MFLFLLCCQHRGFASCKKNCNRPKRPRNGGGWGGTVKTGNGRQEATHVLLAVHDRIALTNFQTDTRIDIESIEIYITYIMECIGLATK